MINKHKITKKQAKKMLDYLSGKAHYDGIQRRNTEFLYNTNTPENVYVKYTSYGLGDKNEMVSENEIVCIAADGKTYDCMEQFDTLKEKMAFAADFIPIEIDRKGNIIE